MSIDVGRHDYERMFFRYQGQQQQEEEDDGTATAGSSPHRRRQMPTPDRRRSVALNDVHAKCTCHDACNEQERQLAREIEVRDYPSGWWELNERVEANMAAIPLQKLRDALDALKRESDKEIAYLKDQLVAVANTASMSPVRAAGRPAPSPPGSAVRSNCAMPLPISVNVLAAPRSTATVSTGTSAPVTLVPTLYAVSSSGGSSPCGSLHLVAADNSSRKVLSVKAKAAWAIPPFAAQACLREPLAVAERVLAAFSPPGHSSQSQRDLQPNAAYFYSLAFCDDMAELSALACATLQSEPRCLALSSPTYVFGDLHGNLRDLSFFAGRIWQPLGVSLSAGSLLFLGDYVDRGAMSLEVVAYLLALKLLHPRKVFLLRGNHETRAVNGLEEIYGGACLLAQCRARFGDERGRQLWDQLNSAFDRLPLAATIDNDVFCVHGGIPRPPVVSSSPQAAATLSEIQRLPAVASLDTLLESSGSRQRGLSTATPQPSPLEKQQAMISELLWGDPVRGSEADEEEGAGLDAQGFGRSARGGAAITFGARAVGNFLAANGLSRILRAHEAAVEGVSLSQSARVVTLFSTSADHGLGASATCACALVENQQLRVFNRTRASLVQPPLVLESESSGASERQPPRQRRWSVTLGRPGQQQYQHIFQETARLPAASMVMDRIPSDRCRAGTSAARHLLPIRSGDNETDEETDDDEETERRDHREGGGDNDDDANALDRQTAVDDIASENNNQADDDQDSG